MTTPVRQKRAFRFMVDNPAFGEEISFKGTPVRALVNRNVADQPFDRIDISIHIDDLTTAPAYQDPAVIDGTTWKVISEGNTRPRNLGDRWLIPLGHGERASSAKFKQGRV